MPDLTEEKFDEREREFYRHIGIAITEWAFLEDELFHICASILKAAQHHTAIIYYRTPTLDGRLSLVDELASTVFPNPERNSGGHPHEAAKLWKEIAKSIRDGLAIRRQLAHSPCAQVV